MIFHSRLLAADFGFSFGSTLSRISTMGPGEFLIWLGLAERVARRRRNKKFLLKEKMLFFPEKDNLAKIFSDVYR